MANASQNRGRQGRSSASMPTGTSAIQQTRRSALRCGLCVQGGRIHSLAYIPLPRLDVRLSGQRQAHRAPGGWVQAGRGPEAREWGQRNGESSLFLADLLSGLEPVPPAFQPARRRPGGRRYGRFMGKARVYVWSSSRRRLTLRLHRGKAGCRRGRRWNPKRKQRPRSLPRGGTDREPAPRRGTPRDAVR